MVLFLSQIWNISSYFFFQNRGISSYLGLVLLYRMTKHPVADMYNIYMSPVCMHMLCGKGGLLKVKFEVLIHILVFHI